MRYIRHFRIELRNVVLVNITLTGEPSHILAAESCPDDDSDTTAQHRTGTRHLVSVRSDVEITVKANGNDKRHTSRNFSAIADRLSKCLEEKLSRHEEETYLTTDDIIMFMDDANESVEMIMLLIDASEMGLVASIGSRCTFT